MTAVSCAASSAVLIRSALRGELSAARRLERRLTPVLYARARLLFSHDVEDMAQHVWLRLLERDGARLKAYDPRRGVSLETYVGVIARHILLNERRARQADRRTPTDLSAHLSEPLRPDTIIIGEDLAEHLLVDVARTLPDRGRAVLWHCFFCEQSALEVARLMGASRQVVYNWQHQIRRRARTFLEAQVA